MPKLADVPKLKVISSGTSPIDPYLKYPNGTNFDESRYCYAIEVFRDRPDDFNIHLYEIGNAKAAKSFTFRGVHRLERVRKHMDSLTNEQLKDFLNKTSR